LALLLDNKTGDKSRWVEQIVAIKLAPLQQATRRTIQLDAAGEPDDLTAGFSASF